MAARGKRWTFTLNNYTDDEVTHVNEYLDSKDVRYAVYGRENEGTPHLQGYVVLVNKISRNALKIKLGTDRIHLEKANGTEEQNYTYCTKDGDFVQFGRRSNPGKRSDLLVVADKLREGRKLREIADEHPETYARYHRGIQALQVQLIKPYAAPDVRGVWIFGPAGSGKSLGVRSKYGDEVYSKPQSKWWDGYQGEKVALLDDLDKQGSCLSHYMKKWADSYAEIAETKGGHVHLRHQLFIVTSNYRIEEIYGGDEELIKAIHRRFTFVLKDDIDKPFVPGLPDLK